ncbi:type II secretion system protein N [Pseudobacteriovorax antillogorgiicola]|uniref:Type II secretion system protein C n=1 Tax=Pseudobacteriovorax antillogorgiicola TaxID=1513793 RepID=A0A1Y6BC16_9BACT|nr:type II secretion system protein N [Pseudobacteriovorax antillogorgiicola]TCS58718.1 type II secretion system protein C [Pseudobacteriovorax antillogorgiicola]SME95416.1 type II secretion system protein C [Pseudobacteriovorax antillogorgiicola]
MVELKEKILVYWKNNEDLGRRLAEVGARSGVVLFLSYMAASTVSSFLIGFISGPAIQPIRSVGLQADRPDVRKTLNYRQVRKDVVKRNIFNSTGELPDESDPSANQERPMAEFNVNDKCNKSSLPLELVGIIYSANPASALASVKEKGYNIADIYRAGDPILGHEAANVYAVQPSRLVINNNGVKECLEIKSQKGRSFSSSPTRTTTEPVKSDPPPSDDLATVQLESSFVEESLGPGFAKILESGRLVPYNRDGSMIGFKLIGVKAKSLWKKAGLNSGDVITSVNGVSMAQPDKGFEFYTALQNEREIRVEYLKKGKSPSNISIEIK